MKRCKYIRDSNRGYLKLSLLVWVWLGHSHMTAQEVEVPAMQEVRAEAEIKFGPRTDLVNGKKYYYPYSNATGNPFLVGPVNGSLQISGRTYTGQQLKYDIYNHQVILDYREQSEATVSIVINEEWLNGFTLGERTFQKFDSPEGMPRYGQVVYTGSVSCIYFWKKKYSPELQQGTKRYEFSDPVRTAFIKSGDHWRQYSGKRSFLKSFPKENHESIRAILKMHGTKFRKLNDRQMHDLMELIDQLPDNEV